MQAPTPRRKLVRLTCAMLAKGQAHPEARLHERVIGNLTWHAQQMGLPVVLRATDSGKPVTRRGSEGFVKLQVDVDEVRGMW